jgi:DoxX.
MSKLIHIILGFLLVTFRLLFGLFWLLAGINKVNDQWMTSPILENIFLQRLTELPPDSFAVFYLTNFAIPFYQPIGWFITIGEIYSAIGLLIGLTTRSSALVSLFILFNFAIGGYYDASLLPFFILVLLFIKYPTGQWFGLDSILSRRFPNYRIFR